MFIGHYAAALVGKRMSTRPSLGWLFAACQLPDLLWPIFLLTGVERVSIDPGNTAFTPLAFDYYPWSHSLLMDVVWGVLLGALYFLLKRDKRGAALVAALVVSHWILDWITHRPDMPLLPDNGRLLGLGLWNNVSATFAVEGLFFIIAVWSYSSMTSARDRVGRIGFWLLVAFLAGTFFANAFSPPPPSVSLIAASGLALWVLLPLAAWVDSHRTPGRT
jgi:membrane-bound metal-dependent hydrolase YbcI (DUF457 family)